MVKRKHQATKKVKKNHPWKNAPIINRNIEHNENLNTELRISKLPDADRLY